RDWSSDVCSSDLLIDDAPCPMHQVGAIRRTERSADRDPGARGPQCSQERCTVFAKRGCEIVGAAACRKPRDPGRTAQLPGIDFDNYRGLLSPGHKSGLRIGPALPALTD